MKQETFNSKRGLKEVQIKDPNTCEDYKEVGCVKDVCDCYNLVAKQETLEEVAENHAKSISSIKPLFRESTKKTFIEGVKWQKERSYSEEDMRKAYSIGWITRERFDDLSPDIIYPQGLDYEEKQDYAFNLWFNKFKKE